jgi:hypothetical protein
MANTGTMIIRTRYVLKNHKFHSNPGNSGKTTLSLMILNKVAENAGME